MVNLPKVTFSNCNLKGKLLLSHLRKYEICQSKYDIASMENEIKEKNRENTGKRKAEKAQQVPETNEKSGEMVQSCVLGCPILLKILQTFRSKKYVIPFYEMFGFLSFQNFSASS